VCATAGQDNILRFWDLERREETRFVRLGGLTAMYEEDLEPTALRYAPDGEAVAVGFAHGAVWILQPPPPTSTPSPPPAELKPAKRFVTPPTLPYTRIRPRLEPGPPG
jgi:hypothetical protein